jgi:hypothetical protein
MSELEKQTHMSGIDELIYIARTRIFDCPHGSNYSKENVEKNILKASTQYSQFLTSIDKARKVIEYLLGVDGAEEMDGLAWLKANSKEII